MIAVSRCVTMAAALLCLSGCGTAPGQVEVKAKYSLEKPAPPLAFSVDWFTWFAFGYVLMSIATTGAATTKVVIFYL